jgi:hypothetical protein
VRAQVTATFRRQHLVGSPFERALRAIGGHRRPGQPERAVVLLPVIMWGKRPGQDSR